MSKQPKKRLGVSRLRRSMQRLHDLPIWTKLALIMIVPTFATVVVGVNGVIDHAAAAGNAERARVLASVVESSGQLIDGLQNERAAGVLVLGYVDQEAQSEQYRSAYTSLHGRVDEAVGPYSKRRAELTDIPDNVSDLLTEIDRNLGDLPAIRSQVMNGQIRLSDATHFYDMLIGNLLNMRDSAMQLAGDFALSERIRAAAEISRAKEYLSQKRIVVHRAFIQRGMTPILRNEFIAADQGQAQAIQSFHAIATTAEAELHSATVAGPDLRAADHYITWVKTGSGTSLASAPFDVNQWDNALIAHARLIQNVETRLDAGVVAQATALRDSVRRQLLLETGLLSVMLLLAILFTWLVARSMARSLRELRQGALAVAQFGLPQAVARLRDPQLTAQMSPAQVAEQIAEPLPVRGKDEFGQVAEAFNAVHLEAVRTAAEQAALRASVATMFINLARRSQILVDRLIGHLDRLERGEEDPDRLAELFKLDHLATRMRRNDENLLVLAGADSTRVQRQPASLADVLRAAQSEVEHYTRIEFGLVDRDIQVAAHAVNDMVHLVAELLDNATSFSPPDSQVVVEARRVGDRAVLYIEDRGIGIGPEQLAELNERLANPPTVDVAVSRMMGLVVVARLADRHGVKVELRSGGDRGTVAQVTVPASVLVQRALGSSPQHQDGVVAADRDIKAAPQTPVTHPPLAITGPGSTAAGPAVAAGLGGQRFDPTSVNGGLSGPNESGPLPAWSDLTGAMSATSGDQVFTPQSPTRQFGEPLPQRRARDGATEDETLGATSGIPRQMPRDPQARPMESWPPLRPSDTGSPTAMPPTPVPAGSMPTSVPPAEREMPAIAQPLRPAAEPAKEPATAALPAWPPLPASERETPTAPPAPAPSTPAPKTTAPAGMTAELPRVPSPTAHVPVPRAPESRTPYADETMELPIFREVESAWFRTRRSVPDGVGSVGNGVQATERVMAADAGGATGSPTREVSGQVLSDRERPMSAGTAGNAAMMNTQASGGPNGAAAAAGGPAGSGGGSAGGWDNAPTDGWRTAADQGWRAASAAADVKVNETTARGLPKRVPMAQLVPGGVDDRPTDPMQRRTPEGVRGLLSAYHRGVQRGRSNTKDGNSGTNPAAGQPFSQPGPGPAAGSGQKEHQG